jgi:hypothetical protein
MGDRMARVKGYADPADARARSVFRAESATT